MKKQVDNDALTGRDITLREKFSLKVLLYSAIVLLASLVIYIFSHNESVMGVFGFLIIVSGSFVCLFLIIYLIFYFLGNSKYKNNVKKNSAGSKKLKVKKK